jgi:hypothetical protein
MYDSCNLAVNELWSALQTPEDHIATACGQVGAGGDTGTSGDDLLEESGIPMKGGKEGKRKLAAAGERKEAVPMEEYINIQLKKMQMEMEKEMDKKKKANADEKEMETVHNEFHARAKELFPMADFSAGFPLLVMVPEEKMKEGLDGFENEEDDFCSDPSVTKHYEKCQKGKSPFECLCKDPKLSGCFDECKLPEDCPFFQMAKAQTECGDKDAISKFGSKEACICKTSPECCVEEEEKCKDLAGFDPEGHCTAWAAGPEDILAFAWCPSDNGG